MSEDFIIGGETVHPGQKKTININIARLYDYTELCLSLKVIRGVDPGPTIFLSGAIHGDEIIGPAIINRILRSRRLRRLAGTLIAVPIVNVFGFNTGSRYLPDRRDLNRCFPGSPTGSLASRIAHIFLQEIVSNCQFGIDFHSAAVHRSNLPQIRSSLESPIDQKLAQAFGAPVIVQSKLRDGSLRQAAEDMGVNMLLYEAGEALRVNESYVKHAVNGTFSMMAMIGMLKSTKEEIERSSHIARSSYWVRAPQSGMLRYRKHLGQRVDRNSVLGMITDAFGENSETVQSRAEGIIIGISQLPLVNKGDALFHVATFSEEGVIEELEDDLLDFSHYQHPLN